MFKGGSLCILAIGILYFHLYNLFLYSPLPLYSHPLFPQLSVHILISSSFTDVMFYDTADALSFSFPFLLSLSSLEQFHYY
jgi:hypothetical protein